MQPFWAKHSHIHIALLILYYCTVLFLLQAFIPLVCLFAAAVLLSICVTLSCFSKKMADGFKIRCVAPSDWLHTAQTTRYWTCSKLGGWTLGCFIKVKTTFMWALSPVLTLANPVDWEHVNLTRDKERKALNMGSKNVRNVQELIISKWIFPLHSCIEKHDLIWNSWYCHQLQLFNKKPNPRVSNTQPVALNQPTNRSNLAQLMSLENVKISKNNFSSLPLFFSLLLSYFSQRLNPLPVIWQSKKVTAKSFFIVSISFLFPPIFKIEFNFFTQ